MKGGPFKYVDSFGADKIVNKMKEFEQIFGSQFTPCDLLVQHAKDKSKKFYPTAK